DGAAHRQRPPHRRQGARPPRVLADQALSQRLSGDKRSEPARMAEASVTTAPAIATTVRRLAPGFLLSALVAVLAVVGAPFVARVITIPAMVLALLIGIALHAVAARPVFQPGLVFCVKT